MVSKRPTEPGRFIAGFEPDLFEAELLIEELARGVVIGDRQLGPRSPGVGGRNGEQRQCLFGLDPTQIADLDHRLFAGACGGGCNQQEGRCDEESDHHSHRPRPDPAQASGLLFKSWPMSRSLASADLQAPDHEWQRHHDASEPAGPWLRVCRRLAARSTLSRPAHRLRRRTDARTRPVQSPPGNQRISELDGL